MAKKEPFALVYDPEIVEHLDAIERKYHSLIPHDDRGAVAVRAGDRDPQSEAVGTAYCFGSEMGTPFGAG